MNEADILKDLAMRDKIIRYSAEIEVQLMDPKRRPSEKPIMEILIRAQERAAEALAAFAEVDAVDVNKIRELQMCINIYREIVDIVRSIIFDGIEFDREHDEEAQDLVRRAVNITPEQVSNMRAMGIEPDQDEVDDR